MSVGWTYKLKSCEGHGDLTSADMDRKQEGRSELGEAQKESKIRILCGSRQGGARLILSVVYLNWTITHLGISLEKVSTSMHLVTLKIVNRLHEAGRVVRASSFEAY